MLQTFKIIHGFDDVKSETWFNIVVSGEHRLTPLTADPLNLIPSNIDWKELILKTKSSEFMEQFARRS